MTHGIFFQHGWGFDKNTWKEWLPYCPYEAIVADRGYFSSPQEPTQNSDVVITHSLGLHLLPQSRLENCTLLVLISSFQEFHPTALKQRRVSQHTLLKMQEMLQNKEPSVLLRFYQRCGLPIKELPNSIEWSALQQDLQYLNALRLDIKRLKHIPQVVILHGGKDAIVSVEKSEELSCSLPGSKLIKIPGAGHALPMTHRKMCWNAILKHLPPRVTHFKADIARAFSKQAQAYHQHAHIQKQASHTLCTFFPPPHSIPLKPILEIGCGTGFVTQNLLETYKEHPLVITDLAEGMLRFCQENLRSKLLTAKRAVNFRILDGEHLTGGPYSMIISGMTFQWFIDLPKALSRLYASLEKGGVLLFSYLENKSFAEWKQMTSLCNLPAAIQRATSINSWV